MVLTAVRSAVIVLALLFIYDYFTMKRKQRLIILFILFIFACVLYVTGILEEIPLFTKTQVAMLNGDATNGRGVLTMIGFEYFLKHTSSIQKVMGIGIDNIRQNVYWNNLHAHNDVVNILLGYGGLYLGIVVGKIVQFCRGKNSVIIFLVIGALAYFNGFYMYTEAVVALPIIKMALSSIKINRLKIKCK